MIALRLGDLIQYLVAAPDRQIRQRLWPTRVAILTGVIFVFAGLVKFVFHHWELHAFRSFGLPWPAAMEIVAGVVEVVGGGLLIVRRLVVPSTVVLAVTMIVAISSSGIGNGDVIPSLTLAPALLLAVVYLLVEAIRSDRGLEHRSQSETAARTSS
jgi:uncharacterized membrane protein YphA (DoxX/SURF4 family)